MFKAWPMISPAEDPFKLATGTRTLTKMYPKTGPIVAPKILPPSEIRDPRLVTVQAMAVAATPKKADNSLVMMVSRSREMPSKQESWKWDSLEICLILSSQKSEPFSDSL